MILECRKVGNVGGAQESSFTTNEDKEDTMDNLQSVIDAAEIMGDNFFGPEEWALCGVAVRLRDVPLFPWSRKILEEPCPFTPGKLVKETHVAYLLQEVLRRGLSHRFAEPDGHEIFSLGHWVMATQWPGHRTALYVSDELAQALAWRRSHPGWHLVFKGVAVPGEGEHRLPTTYRRARVEDIYPLILLLLLRDKEVILSEKKGSSWILDEAEGIRFKVGCREFPRAGGYDDSPEIDIWEIKGDFHWSTEIKSEDGWGAVRLQP